MPARTAPAVFLNIPFDDAYEPLAVALVASIVGLGGEPRTVLDIPDHGQGRLKRLLPLIGRCGASIHDLSRIELSEGHPRFNMPFELGLAYALSRTIRRKHRVFVFEEKPFRLQRTLSDFNAVDPQIHGGKPHRIVHRVLHCLGGTHAEPAPERLVKLADDLARAVPELRRRFGVEHVFETPLVFRKLVAAARILAER